MATHSQQLQAIQEQIGRKKHLEAALNDLYVQRAELIDKTEQLKTVMLDEQKDVDRLEHGSLSAFFYEIIGKKDEKIAKEKKEAYAARVKYDAAARELEAVESELRRSEAEIESLQSCEENYERLLQEVLTEIKVSGNPLGEKIVQIEQRISALHSQQKELEEAIAAGKIAMSTVDTVRSHLDDAEGWGTWDIFGGGLLSDIAKHDALDSAQQAVEQLQVQLRAFKTELVDVSVDVNIQASIEGFLGFADFFFDGLFADWAVMEQIEQAVRQVNNTKSQLSDVLNRLQEMETTTQLELNHCHQQLSEVAVTA